MKLIKVRLLISFLLIILYTTANIAGNEDAIRNTFRRFKEGWENKDINKLSSCFINLSDNQKYLYNFVFGYADKITISIDIAEIKIYNKFAAVKTTLTKNIHFSYKDITAPQIETKKINYLMGKKGVKWHILGTVEIDPKKEKMAVTDKNLDTINKQLDTLPQEQREAIIEQLKNIKDYTIKITASERTIKWTPVPKTAGYNVIFSKQSAKTEKSPSVIWEKKEMISHQVSLPVEIYNKMSSSYTYYFNVYALNAEKQILSIQVIKVKR